MITIELYQGRARTTNGRQQKWRWHATAPNHHKLATSAEAYTNKQDCLDAIQQLFGQDSSIILNQPNQPAQTLRTTSINLGADA